MRVAEGDKVKGARASCTSLCSAQRKENTRSHLHAADLSRCTDGNSTGGERKRGMGVHLGQDGRRSISALSCVWLR